jgi:hypothetical protein
MRMTLTRGPGGSAIGPADFVDLPERPGLRVEPAMDSSRCVGSGLWRRFWFDLEDPRAMAAVRIAFGTLVVCNINGLWEYFGFLFSDEGVFPADVAQQVFAKAQFAGFGDGLSPAEPWGFFDARAVVECLRGPRFSLLYFWDSPTAVWIHVAAFELCMAAMIVGLWTRATAILGCLLMNSLFDRNPLFWEGTELVFRVFFVYLLCARSGHAWSIDNAWRCWRQRRRGVAHRVHRLIPTWPRRLMMLQLAVVYLDTGLLKNGSVWAHGDAVYYAMNLDHFYRLEPQAVAAVLGTNVLRVATWFVRFGEVGFALVFVGEVLRTVIEVRSPRRSRGARALAWTRRWILGRRIWITWAVATMGGIFVTMNIGMFQPVMLALCLVYFRGEELARGIAWLRGRPRTAAASLDVAPPSTGSCYGPAGRLVVSAILLWHGFAVGVWLTPERDAIAAVRTPARALVRPWLEFTRTAQGWGMFAPNPPRHNVFMKVLVTDADGEVWDMRSDVYAPERRALPFMWNDRMRKMNRRIIGGEPGGSWYRKWYARWHCRQWAIDHGGSLPRKVELVKLSYAIPTPEAMRERGWYRPADRLRDFGTSTPVHLEYCATAVLGQPLPVVAERHGIVSAAHRPWIKGRRVAWDQQ